MEDQLCSEMTGNNAGLNGEESSFMESPKQESSEWTDEKHSLYLKSMEASFVDKLYNSLDMQCWQTQNECSSDSLSSKKIHAPSGQFKVLQHGFWSRVDFKRESMAHNEVNRHNVSSSNPWIQHFRNGNRHGAIESPSPRAKLSSTICVAEVMDQNFVEEDFATQSMNTCCNKKRKGSYGESESGNDQVAASFGHFSCNRNH
ncbi:cold-regulated protein 27-like [Bidens hawaiensis]|uniref:cold-regulated protein 27-like n=1 Tax=Bidens hawaiensis TaxID=980011 RepID=UPI00404B7FE9